MYYLVVFCSVSFSAVVCLSDIKYSNRWSVQVDGGKEEADRLAKKHGFVNEGKVIHNYYSFQHQNVERVSKLASTHKHEGLALERNVKMVEQQVYKSYKLLSNSQTMNINDPRWNDMWYMNRMDGPTYNVMEVWKKGITGQGVVVAVVDEGFDPSHPEIQANYDARASFDFIENDASPTSSNKSVPQYGHAENCAGVIAAVLNNSKCGVGLAYKAKLGGIRLFFDEMATDASEAKALSYERDYIDIYSNSWGPGDKGFEVVGPDKLTQLALKDGAEKGRGGLGSIFVFAAGNGGIIVKDSCAFNGYVNNIHTIAITGINRDGSIPGYGEHCAGIMAVAYSRDVFGDTGPVVTAGLDGTCENNFGGSSAAAAMASGLIALMLNVNKELSWRDVQHIIVRSSSPASVKGISEGGWTVNNDGLKVNDYVGFGLMDASRMVELASSWRTVPEKVNCNITQKGFGVNKKIHFNETLSETINLSNMSDECGGVVINYLEHVEVHVNLNYSRRGDLLIKITSPKGTVSNLTHYRLSDSFFKLKDLNWVLMTLHLWGETAVGEWKLTFEDSQPQHQNEGILFDWALILHGTTSNPLGQNPHFLTNSSTNASTPTSPRPMNKTTTLKVTTESSWPKASSLPTQKTTAKLGTHSPTTSISWESSSTNTFALATMKTSTKLAESSSPKVSSLPSQKTTAKLGTPSPTTSISGESSSPKTFASPTVKASTKLGTPSPTTSISGESSSPKTFTLPTVKASTKLAESSSPKVSSLPTQKTTAKLGTHSPTTSISGESSSPKTFTLPTVKASTKLAESSSPKVSSLPTQKTTAKLETPSPTTSISGESSSPKTFTLPTVKASTMLGTKELFGIFFGSLFALCVFIGASYLARRKSFRVKRSRRTLRLERLSVKVRPEQSMKTEQRI